MKKNFINIILLILFFSGLNGLFSQENTIKKEIKGPKEISTESKKIKPVIKDDKSEDINKTKETKVKKVVKKIIKKKNKKDGLNKIRDNIKRAVTESDEKDINLLYIKDGSYKYKRIPGFKEVNKTKENPENEIVKIPENKKESENVNIDINKNFEKGLFGLSKETTDLIARGALVFLILIIFILYRMRSKKTSHNVLRRYPNK